MESHRLELGEITMKRIARRLAAALRRQPDAAVVHQGVEPLTSSWDGADLPERCRRSEAFAEDLGGLISRPPMVLAPRDLMRSQR